MIDLTDIGRDYAMGEVRVHALAGVTLSIEAGESVAILGPSGSGKSTLLHVIGCLDTPTSGSYRLDGVEVARLGPAELAAVRNEKIGFVFQSFHLLPRSSALENVMLPLRLAGVGLGERRRRATELLERFGLGDRLRHRPAELSGGQQQRVALARALANRPRLLLADEPTGNLDSQSGADVMTLLGELNEAGTTLVVVTHDEELARASRRVIRMHDGRVVEDAGVAVG